MLNKKYTYIIKMYQSCKTTKKHNYSTFYHIKNTKKKRERTAVPSTPIRSLIVSSISQIDQLFSGRSLRTVTAVCHISLSRRAFSSSFSFSR